MPNVEILRIHGLVSMETRAKVMMATPNVTTLLIQESEIPWDDRSVSINFREISNLLPKLQSFGWLICRLTHHDLLHSLDAAITGLPVEFCKKNSEKFRVKDSLSAGELGFYQTQKRISSILDLKGM